jgi:hypothetical protein
MQLERSGFAPFGATLGPARAVQLLIPESAKSGTMTIDVVDAYWRRQMSKAIEAGNVRALCTVADVRETDGQGKLVPGVFVHIEHFLGDAEDLLYFYAKLESSRITFQEPIRDKAALQFFTVM